jgi:hypothetical protein
MFTTVYKSDATARSYGTHVWNLCSIVLTDYKAYYNRLRNMRLGFGNEDTSTRSRSSTFEKQTIKWGRKEEDVARPEKEPQRGILVKSGRREVSENSQLGTEVWKNGSVLSLASFPGGPVPIVHARAWLCH